MERKIRVGAVGYLNARPLIYGLEKGLMGEQIELVNSYPSQIAEMLLKDEIDVGLVPVTTIPHLLKYDIISDFCIGCNGPVASVCLFSEVPFGEIKNIQLDYQSRTSVELLKILLKEYWHAAPALVSRSSEFLPDIKGSSAGLVIGDRALEQRQKSPFIYDLGEAWKQFTGLPFVFAAWISNKELPSGFKESFNEANFVGLQQLKEIAHSLDYPFFDLEKYFTQYISYDFDLPKKQAMELFLQKYSASLE